MQTDGQKKWKGQVYSFAVLQCVLTREGELDLAVNSTGPDQGGVETLDTVSGHDHLHREN
jgi:hypothetical protein